MRRRGLSVLRRNYDCPVGEIDLICSHGDALVFVEVKTRTSDQAEAPHEALRPDQWRRIENAAKYFLMRYSVQHRPCRFDVVTVLWPQRRRPVLEHFENVQFPGRPK